jgi:hypothetical protein
MNFFSVLACDTHAQCLLILFQLFPVCTHTSVCVFYMEIYTAEGIKFVLTVLLALQTNMGIDHHRVIHQDGFYNSVNCVRICYKEMQCLRTGC